MCYNINQTERNKTMNNEQKKPVEAEELSEKELEGVVGGGLARAVPMREDVTKKIEDLGTMYIGRSALIKELEDEVAMKLTLR